MQTPKSIMATEVATILLDWRSRVRQSSLAAEDGKYPTLQYQSCQSRPDATFGHRLTEVSRYQGSELNPDCLLGAIWLFLSFPLRLPALQQGAALISLTMGGRGEDLSFLVLSFSEKQAYNSPVINIYA